MTVARIIFPRTELRLSRLSVRLFTASFHCVFSMRLFNAFSRSPFIEIFHYSIIVYTNYCFINSSNHEQLIMVSILVTVNGLIAFPFKSTRLTFLSLCKHEMQNRAKGNSVVVRFVDSRLRQSIYYARIDKKWKRYVTSRHVSADSYSVASALNDLSQFIPLRGGFCFFAFPSVLFTYKIAYSTIDRCTQHVLRWEVRRSSLRTAESSKTMKETRGRCDIAIRYRVARNSTVNGSKTIAKLPSRVTASFTPVCETPGNLVLLFHRFVLLSPFRVSTLWRKLLRSTEDLSSNKRCLYSDVSLLSASNS